MEVDVCFSPALYPAYHDPEGVVVVADVFRATTTMITAFDQGANRLLPVATVEEAIEYKDKGWLVGAERNVKQCDFADFGNSPFDYTQEKVNGKDIVFTTTNGTYAIDKARDAWRVILGGFINLQAVAEYCLEYKRNVLILCSGWHDKVNIEDTLFGGALTAILQDSGFYQTGTDAGLMAWEFWRAHKNNLQGYIMQTDHFCRLRENGQEDVVPYCLTLNSSNKVPQLLPGEPELILI